jgi:outer membrane immunogenic protein
MKKLLLASVGVLALGITTASAADIARRPVPYKAPAYVEPAFSWTGFYLGLNGGYGFGRSDFAAPLSTGSFDVNGGLVGGTVGYNWQMGALVLGLEGDVDWSDIRGSVACGPGTCATRNDWLGTARARLGYAMGRFMPYVTGGAAFGDIKTSVTGFADSNKTKAGWTVGGGVEANIAGPWSVKAEYLYVDLGRTDSPVIGADAKFQTSIVRAGVNYHF